MSTHAVHPTARPVDREWTVGLPKAEVHVHLEGCIPTDVLVGAARAADHPDAESLASDFAFTDLASFLEHLDRSCRLIRRADDLHAIAYRYGERARAVGVDYADVIVNLTHWPEWRGRLDEMLEALDRGFADGSADGHPEVGLCISIKRTQTSAEAIELVEWVLGSNHPRVVALSIDGNEAATGRTSARFADAFRLAADKGLHRCVHAGESSGPEGIRDALDHLLAERIDHGIRAVEDPALVRELAERGVCLDICPTSNVLLGVAPSLEAHPVDELRRAGVAVSLNTDDPLLFGTDVAREYETAAAAFGWARADVAAMARTSIDAAFCRDEERSRLHGLLDAYETGAAAGADLR